MRKLKTLLILSFLLLMIPCYSAKAASLGTPKLDILSAYMNDSIYLKWKKVKGFKFDMTLKKSCVFFIKLTIV